MERIKLSDLSQPVQNKNGFRVYCHRQSLINWSLSRGLLWQLGASFSGKNVKVVEKINKSECMKCPPGPKTRAAGERWLIVEVRL